MDKLKPLLAWKNVGVVFYLDGYVADVQVWKDKSRFLVRSHSRCELPSVPSIAQAS